MRIFTLLAVFLVLSAAAEAATISTNFNGVTDIVIGEKDGNNVFPFGTPSYVGSQYQQDYAASAFVGQPLLISGLGFDLQLPPSLNNPATVNVTIALSTGSIHSLNFADNVGSDSTVVFNGDMHLGPGNPAVPFDTLISLQQMFMYNPTAGDLLMTVTTNSYDGGPVPLWAGFTPESYRLFRSSGNGDPTIDGLSLYTLIEGTTPTPEPSYAIVITALLSASLLGRKRVRSGRSAK